MASQVELANRALTKIGEARILTLTDNVESARVVESVWDVTRDAELRARNWNFAIVRASLAALVSTPDWGYSYQYQIPTNCLRIIQVDQWYAPPVMSDYIGASESYWQIESNKILTDRPAPLKVRYVSRVTDCGDWDPLFAEVFACRLAVEICERLTQSRPKRELAHEEYKMAIRAATRSDAVENPPEAIPDSAWVLARL